MNTFWHVCNGKLEEMHTKFYFQLQHKAGFYTPTCFSYLLQPLTGSYNIIQMKAAYCMSVNDKHKYVSFI